MRVLSMHIVDDNYTYLPQIFIVSLQRTTINGACLIGRVTIKVTSESISWRFLLFITQVKQQLKFQFYSLTQFCVLFID